MLGASVWPKLSGMAIPQELMTSLGWPDFPVRLVGTIELVCTILYLIPATAVLGAVLMMGVLGGAIATNLHAESSLFGQTLFGVYLGLVMWGGLWLRMPSLRAVFPIRRDTSVQQRFDL